MYNKALYDHYIARGHHVHRQPFPAALIASVRDEKLSPTERMMTRLRLVFDNEKPVILDGQRIVFLRTVTDVPDIFTEDEWAAIRDKHYIHELGYVSNICANYGRIITSGLEAEREKLAAKLGGDLTDKQRQFVTAALSGIDALYGLVDRYRAEALRIGREDVAAVFDRIPRQGATSFREALQFVRILNYTLWAEGEYHNTLGRFDQYMMPFLKADLDAGKLTAEEAQSLLEEFFLSVNWDSDMYPGVQLGDNGQSMMLGGVTPSGEDAYNELTRMCLQASCSLLLIDPKINLRVGKDTPMERYIEGTHLTKAGLGFPQYSNDDVVIPNLIRLGYAPEDARNYSVAACWEFIVAGCAMDVNNIGALSFPMVVEKAVEAVLPTAPDFDTLMAEIKKNIEEGVEKICADFHDLYFIPAPFYSVLMDDCVEQAKDISEGARYNNFGIHGTGVATAADSLAAIKMHVFDEKTVTGADLLKALHNNFDGNEALLYKLRNETPKMGNNDDRADSMAVTLLNWFADSVEGRRNERGGIYRVGPGSAMFYLQHADELTASADGRRKKEAFGTNFSPSLYVRNNGPFSVIQSFTKCPVGRTINGGPLTMEFHSTVFDTEEGIEGVAALVKAYIDKGGHQLQLNSINRERLLDAQAHPENYGSLIVRIWGWSAYFVELEKKYQDHLIARQEFTNY
ncbi:MAG: pyruvate formate-lyase [Clostridia bacterium]|nr:pyruvate formate-lyase [Clostridia bacterium]